MGRPPRSLRSLPPEGAQADQGRLCTADPLRGREAELREFPATPLGAARREAWVAKEVIARRVAQEFHDGYVVNLGIGLPTLVPRYLPAGVHITLQSENGFLGLAPLEGEPLPGVVNAGGMPCGLMPGAAMFDSAMSFALIRGGHVDVTVLGGLQVDEAGNLANWMVPGKMVPGMGGAMDLVTGARKVIVAMEHCTRDGEPRILDRCTLPLTARGRVSMVVTELAVFRITHGEFVLIEHAPGVSLADIRACSQARFAVADELKAMDLGR